MSKYRQLSTTDVLFVAGENSRTYHHTAGLVILEHPAKSRLDFERIRNYIIERVGQIPHFHWKLHEVPLGLDLPYWVEDENFSYDHHIRRIAVPSPGDRQVLGEVVAHLYSKHMDRSRPLWEMWFIEGLEDGRVALLQKLHHSVMDGQGAARLGEILSDFRPNAKPKKLDPEIPNARPGEVPDTWQLYANSISRLSRLPLNAGREIGGLLQSGISKRLSRGQEEKEEKPSYPHTFFNGTVGRDRGFIFGSLPLAEIKQVKNHFGVTVNDVILALVGTSMSQYMEARGKLPESSLRATIAISLRREEDDEFSNQVTQAPVTLATDVAGLGERLRAIHQESESAKQVARGGGKGLVEFMQMLPPLLVTTMINITSAEQATAMMGANLVISNVRGSDKPMYIAGARMATMYPMSIILSGMGINVTCVSYAGNVDFGMTIDPDMFDQPWTLIDGLELALEQYLALCAPKGRGRKGSAAAVKAASAKRPAARKKAGQKQPAEKRKSRS